MPDGICENEHHLQTPVCVVCGDYAPFFCDYEIIPGQSCDAPMCGQCRTNFGIRDYCPRHAGLPVAR